MGVGVGVGVGEGVGVGDGVGVGVGDGVGVGTALRSGYTCSARLRVAKYPAEALWTISKTRHSTITAVICLPLPC